MKKIGREVLFYAADKDSSRMGEGDFLRLKDGRIMYAYTRYGSDDCDHGAADIYAVYSSDEGETWGGDRLLIKRDENAKNYMSISCRRMNNGDMGVFYIKKTKDLDAIFTLARSADEGETFYTEIRCNPIDGYFVTNNDRVIRLHDGTWMFPANRHEKKENGELSYVGSMYIFASYDDGFTWENISRDIELTDVKNISRTGLQETGLYERSDGSIKAWSRTDLGFQYECYSYDRGRTWTVAVPDKNLISPESPCQIKDTGIYTAAIYNPVPGFKGKEMYFSLDRSPYVISISRDEAVTYEKTFFIEDDINNSYCYPALTDCEGGCLIAYYHSNNTGKNLNSLKITKVMYSEFEE